MLEQNLYELLRVLAGKLNFPASCSLHPLLPLPIELSDHGRHRCNRITNLFFPFFFSFVENVWPWVEKKKKYFSNNRVRRAACFDRLTRPDRLFELALVVLRPVRELFDRSYERIRLPLLFVCVLKNSK